MEVLLPPVQMNTLRELARSPRALDRSMAPAAQALVDLGFARLENGVTGPTRCEITPAGRRLLATAKAPTRPTGTQRLPRTTVASMQREGWRVFSSCDRCGAILAVDLDLTAWRFGGRTRIAEREDHCLAKGCEGRLAYFR